MPKLSKFAREHRKLCLSVVLVFLLGAVFFYVVPVAHIYTALTRPPLVTRHGACDSERATSRGDAAQVVVANLVEALRDGRVGERYRAAHCLSVMGGAAGEAVPALVDAVHDGAQVEAFEYDYIFFSTVGEAAIEALGRIGPTAALALLGLQGDTDPEIRNAAFEALSGVYPDAEAGGPFFSRALGSRIPEERLAAARLLGEYLPEARGVVADLGTAMGDANPRVRAAAARALRKIAQEDLPAVIPLLIDALADDDDAVRQASVVAFGSFHQRYQHNERIAEIGPDRVDILSASIASDSPKIRRRAIWIVRAIGPSAEGALPAVIAALDDQDVEVRSTAIRALYRFPEHIGRATPILLELLTDPRTTRDVSIVLYEHGVEARLAIPALTDALAHPSPEVRWNAAHVIRRLGSDASDAGDALIGLLRDEDRTVRFHATRAIQSVPANPSHAVPELMELMIISDAQMRTEVAQAIGHFGRDALAAEPLLTEALKDDRDALRQMAAWALGKIGFDPNLVRDAARFFGNEGHRAFAISDDGQSWGWSAGDDQIDEAEGNALAECQRAGTVTCRIYAVDEDILWSDEEWRALIR